MIYSEHCKSFMRLNRIEFSLNALGKKEGPDTLAGRGRSFAPLGRMGDVHHRPLDVRRTPTRYRIDFARCDREHKKAEFTHSKAAGHVRNQRLCLVPHSAVFLDSNRWVVERGSSTADARSSPSPHPSAQEKLALDSRLSVILIEFVDENGGRNSGSIAPSAFGSMTCHYNLREYSLGTRWRRATSFSD